MYVCLSISNLPHLGHFGAFPCLALGAQITPTPTYFLFFFENKGWGVVFVFFSLILAPAGGSNPANIFPNPAGHPAWVSYPAGHFSSPAGQK